MPKADALKVINSRTNGRMHASTGGAIYSGDGMADTLDGFDASKQPGPSLIPVALADGKLDPGWLPEQATSGAGASATGGQVYVAPWVRLARAISATDTTIYLNGDIHAVGDQAILGHYQYGNESIAITGGPIQQGTVYEYTITRAATARAYPAGSTVVFNLGGETDGGFVTIVSGDQQQSLTAPHINLFAYEGGATVRKVRIGRLQGLSAGEKAQFPKVDDWNVYGLYADAAYLRGQIVADSGDIAGDLDVGGTLGVWSGLGRAGVVLGNSEGGHGITLQNREGRPVFGAVSPYEDESGVLSDVAVYIDHEGQRGLYYHKNAATGQYQLDISVDTLIDGTLRATNILAGTGAYPGTFTGMRFGAEGLQGYNAGVAQVDLDVQDGRLYFGNREGWLGDQGMTIDARTKPTGTDELEHTIHWYNSSAYGDLIGAAIGSDGPGGWWAFARKRMLDVGGVGAQAFDDFYEAKIELAPGGTSYLEGTTIEMRPTERWAVVFDPDHVLEFNRARVFAPAVTVAGSLLHTTDDKQSVLVGTNSASGARLISMADSMPAFRATRSNGQTFDISVEASRTLIGASSTIQIYTGAVDASGQGQIIPFGAMRLGSQAAPWADIYATRLHGTIGSQVAIADNSSLYLTQRTMTLGVNLEADNVIAYASQSDLPVGAFFRFEDVDGNQETIRINTVGAVAGDWYEYEVERAQATGQTPLLWYAGTVGVSLGGNATDGYIRLFGTDDLNPATGPSIVIYQRENDDAPESVSERAVFGNLSGWYHYADNADLYGVAFGRRSGAWASMDEANGLRMFWNETQLAQYGEAIDIGQPDAAHLHIDADDVTLFAGATPTIELLGTGDANITGTLAVATGGAITWAGGKGRADDTGIEHVEDVDNFWNVKPDATSLMTLHGANTTRTAIMRVDGDNTVEYGLLVNGSKQGIYVTHTRASHNAVYIYTSGTASSALSGESAGANAGAVVGRATGAGGKGISAIASGSATTALQISGGIVDGGSQRYTAMGDATADTDGLNRQTADARYAPIGGSGQTWRTWFGA